MLLSTIKFNFLYIILTVVMFFPLAHAQQSIVLTKRQLCDLELIINGGFAPLKGFMTKADYDSVVSKMRLADGTLWPIPIVFDVNYDVIKKLEEDNWKLELRAPEGHLIALLHIQEVWKPNRVLEAVKVYGTDNPEHPGVDYVLNQTKPFYIGGTIEKIESPRHYDFIDLRKTPDDLKNYFKQNGISKVIAFQTRNPMHRAHQELTSQAAERAQAHLLIHPVVGITKPGDVDYFTRVRCYKKLLNYYKTGSATLALLPLAMRMAGPREALWHAIIRKNYGATHFIVGRDHAGPGADSKGNLFYDPYDAQLLVAQYADEVGITLIPFHEVVYVPSQDTYMEVNHVPQNTETLSISGTQLRALLREGRELPSWFTYPDVAQELRVAYPPRNQQGFTIFFTGLSGSGKSTLAHSLAIKLMELQDRPVSLLDGDIVRQHLSSELSFSKAHRSLNVKRVGFVAHEISKSGGIALCALIAPYRCDRDYNRKMISNRASYIEIYVSTPLTACEQRDTKGLYAKARKGELANFTGISDPYEEPLNPEITIDTSAISLEKSLDEIIQYLKKEGFIA